MLLHVYVQNLAIKSNGFHSIHDPGEHVAYVNGRGAVGPPNPLYANVAMFEAYYPDNAIGNQWAAPLFVNPAGVPPAARVRLDRTSPYVSGGVAWWASLEPPLPTSEALDYAGYPFAASPSRGAFQALDVAGLDPIPNNNPPRTITFTPHPSVNVTLNGAPFTSGSTVYAEGTHTLQAQYPLTGEVISWPPFTVGAFTLSNTKSPGGQTIVDAGWTNTNARIVVQNANSATVNGAAVSVPYDNIVTAEGSYTVTAYLGPVSSLTQSFHIDKTLPIISGVANGAHYHSARTVSYNEGTGILDGAPFSSGTVVSDLGLHTVTVTDQAGNSRTVNFWIDEFIDP
jgi:hypothetical protein